MRWLVISDLHYKYGGFSSEEARKNLISTLRRNCEEISFILIIGDCMYQYERQKGDIKFIKDLASACKVGIKNVFLCPGNHDINRNEDTRKSIIPEIRKGEQEKENLFTNDSLPGYEKFETLYQEIRHEQYFNFNVYSPAKNVQVINIDSCILSLDDNDFHNLQVCFEKLNSLEEKINSDQIIKIVIMHHGVEWLKPEDGILFQHWLADHHIDVLYCGHNHVPGVTTLDETTFDTFGHKRIAVRQFTCGACIFDNKIKPSFYIAEFDEEANERIIKTTLYTYQPNSMWIKDSGSLRTFPSGVNEYKLNIDESREEELKRSSRKYCEKFYENIYDAYDDIADDIKKGDFLEFFGLRGGTFEKEATIVANAMYENEKLQIRFLISYPFSDTIGERLKRVPEFKNEDQTEKQWRNIYQKVESLREDLKDRKNAELRFHCLSLDFRLIITNQNLYIGFYEDINSSKSPMYRYSNGTRFYDGFRNFFQNAWKKAKKDYPSKIPPEHSFLRKTFSVLPSLVINITDQCNMKCSYCPIGGENLSICTSKCETSSINVLMSCFKKECKKIDKSGKLVIRITGGEPLLEPDRLHFVLEKAKELKYDKIVLCTNGIDFVKDYKLETELWDSVKPILLLKISLDTLKIEHFQKLTKAGAMELNKVKESISFAKNLGFRIELNTVSTKENLEDIYDVYNYAKKNGLVGIKVLTVNDFGNRVTPEDTSSEMKSLADYLSKKGFVERDEYLNENKGIQMKRFIDDDKCTLTIVDHNNSARSATPTRTYSNKFCSECIYFPEKCKNGINPCATGIMSLTLRADGMLSFCRLRYDDLGNNISGLSDTEIESIVSTQMKAFYSCYHKTITK